MPDKKDIGGEAVRRATAEADAASKEVPAKPSKPSKK